MEVGLHGALWTRLVLTRERVKKWNAGVASNTDTEVAPIQSQDSGERNVLDQVMTNFHATCTIALVSAVRTFPILTSYLNKMMLHIVPDDFLWSAWGAPDILCSNGTQKRTTLCGDIRRRLPMIPGRNQDEPAGKSDFIGKKS